MSSYLAFDKKEDLSAPSPPASFPSAGFSSSDIFERKRLLCPARFAISRRICGQTTLSRTPFTEVRVCRFVPSQKNESADESDLARRICRLVFVGRICTFGAEFADSFRIQIRTNTYTTPYSNTERLWIRSDLVTVSWT